MFDPNTETRLASIPWLARIREVEPVPVTGWKTEQVSDLSAVQRSIDGEWRLMMEAATSDLQGELFVRDRGAHQRWNEYIKAGNEFLKREVMPAAADALKRAGLAGRSEGVLRWQLASFLIEQAVAHTGVNLFFVHIIEMYEAGHLPCGWAGQVPKVRNSTEGHVPEFFPNGTVQYL